MMGVKESYEDRLKIKEAFKITNRIIIWSLVTCGKYKKEVPMRGTRGHVLKVDQEHNKLDLRKHYFRNCIVTNWNNLPAETAQAEEVPASPSKMTWKTWNTQEARWDCKHDIKRQHNIHATHKHNTTKVKVEMEIVANQTSFHQKT